MAAAGPYQPTGQKPIALPYELTGLPYPPASGITITAEELAEETGTDPEGAIRLVVVASALLTEYAPDAPEPTLNEAVIRVAGYLNDTPASPVGTLRVGAEETTWLASYGSAFRHSGAMALLTRSKHRRAGVI